MRPSIVFLPSIVNAVRAQSPTFPISPAAGLLCTVSSYGLLAPVKFAQTGTWPSTYSINASTGEISNSAVTPGGTVQSLGCCASNKLRVQRQSR